LDGDWKCVKGEGKCGTGSRATLEKRFVMRAGQDSAAQAQHSTTRTQARGQDGELDGLFFVTVRGPPCQSSTSQVILPVAEWVSKPFSSRAILVGGKRSACPWVDS